MKLKKILIVEDDNITRFLVKHYINELSVDIVEAENGAVALEKLKSDSDITDITLDLNMPVMDGFSFLEHVKTEFTDRHLRVYVNSCISKREFDKITNNASYNNATIEKYYEKPFDMVNLKEELKKHL